MGDWVQIGPHRYRIVGELVFLETSGPFLAEHAVVLLTVLKALDLAQSELGLVIDLRGGVQLPPETRRALAEHTDPKRTPLPTLVIGASAAVRTLLSLLLNGLRLLLRIDIPVRFCKETEIDSAMVWLRDKVRVRAMRDALLRSGIRSGSASSHDGAH